MLPIKKYVSKFSNPFILLSLFVSLSLIDTAKPFYSELWIFPRLLCVCMFVHVPHMRCFLGQILRLLEKFGTLI